MGKLSDEELKETAFYTYNDFNQLIRYSDLGGTTTSYAYDVNGLRLAKTVNGETTKFYYDGGYIINEAVNDTEKAVNIHAPGYKQRRENGQTTYYTLNGHGDVAQLTNSSAAVTKNYDYDVFGKEKNIDKNDTNPFRYCGEYTDFETGNIYLRARYYDPGVGRFTSADIHWNTSNMIYGDDGNNGVPSIKAIMQSSNLYTYCINNPIKYTDPTGRVLPGDEQYGVDSLKYRILTGLGMLWTRFPEARAKLHATADKVRGLTIDEGNYNTALNYLYREGLLDENYKFSREICEGVTVELYILAYIAYWRVDEFQHYDAIAPSEVNVGNYYNIDMICFIEGTLISTENGDKKIEEIVLGDKVYSKDEKTGQIGLKEVNTLFRNTSDTIIHIVIGNTSIEATPTHPFWIQGMGWILAKDLKNGDNVLLLSGETKEITEVCVEKLLYPVATYNFEVADWHTYFVSELGVLVHNRCLTNAEARAIAAENGWTEVVGERLMGSLVFTDGTRYYSADRTGHGGSVWKIFPNQAYFKSGKYDSADENLNVIRSKK